MAKKTKAQLRAEYEKAKKSGKVKEAGIGNVASTAAKLAIKVVKSTKATNAAKAAEKTTKNLPKGPTVKNPPKPPMGQRSPQSSGSKAIEDMWVRDAKLKAQRAADLAEDRKRLAQMARDKVANKPKPSKKGPSSGNIASYNWLGK
jgi:predicted Zn-dependent protease